MCRVSFAFVCSGTSLLAVSRLTAGRLSWPLAVSGNGILTLRRAVANGTPVDDDWRKKKKKKKKKREETNITNSRSIGSTCYIARSQQVAGTSSLRLFYSCFRSSIAGRKNANSNEPTNDLGHSWTRRPTRRRVQVAAHKSRPPRAAERGYEWEEGTCDDNPLRGKWFNYCYLFQQRWHDVDVVAARREISLRELQREANNISPKKARDHRGTEAYRFENWENRAVIERHRGSTSAACTTIEKCGRRRNSQDAHAYMIVTVFTIRTQ